MNPEYRTLRLEDGEWAVALDGEAMPKQEAMAFCAHLKRAGISYRIERNLVFVPGSVPWDTVFPAVEDFYRGRAEVVPF